MSLSRVKPIGWTLGDKLTSAEANQIDINVSNAVDKVGGDTITGSIAAIGGVAIGAGGLTLAPGAPFVQDQLATYNPPKTITVVYSVSEIVVAYYVGSGSPPSGGLYPLHGGVQGARTISGFPPSMALKLPRPFQGSTIASAEIGYRVSVGRTALPTSFASISLVRRTINPLGTDLSQTLHTAANYPFPGGTLAAYKTASTLSFACTTNNVVDVDAYNYFAIIIDEQITAPDLPSFGTLYNYLSITYQNVTQARP
jgi:hypothetical protein